MENRISDKTREALARQCALCRKRGRSCDRVRHAACINTSNGVVPFHPQHRNNAHSKRVFGHFRNATSALLGVAVADQLQTATSHHVVAVLRLLYTPEG